MTAAAPASRPLTHHDLEHTPDDGNLYEVIDGVLYVSPFPTYAHQNAATNLLAILHAHVRTHALGKVLMAGLKVVLDEPTGVGPDLVYIATEHLDGMQTDGFHGVPDLIVEVTSAKPMRDRHVKLQRYERAGVPHYWIVDPNEKSLHAYRLEAGRYRLAAELGHEDVFEPELFPGLTFPLSDLWR